ncbi:uncharacterized protein C2orf78 homolog isoform X2 [Pantherophis guttatus]|nr:uncharacterized protein C2orf78 homolog isoform X2 [Pantherophis guttatus]
MAAPVLSNLWIQPPFPHLPAHLLAGNASLQSFVPPGVSHLQTIHGEQLQLANLTPCNPPVSTFPQPFYAPLPPQYQTLPGPGTIQKIPRPSYPQHRLSGHSEAQATSDVGLQLGQRWPLELPTSQPASLQEIRAPEEEPQKAQSYHLPGSLDQPRSSLHQFVGSPLAPSSSLHYDLEDIPHLLPVLEVDQDPGGHPSGASLKAEVPQASRDQEASEPDPSKNFGLNDGGQFQTSSKGKGKRKIPWTEEEPPAKKTKEEEKTQHQMPSKARAKGPQRNKPCKHISAKGAADASKSKIAPCVLEAQDLTQAKMPPELLTGPEEPKAVLPELLPEQPAEEGDSSSSRDSKTGHASCAVEKSQPRSQDKQEARKNVSLCGTKSKKCCPKREAEGAPKPTPKTNLAFKLMESVQVFHPLGKQTVPTLPSKKGHSVPPVPNHLITEANLLPKPASYPSSQPLTTAPKPPLHFLPASQLHLQCKPPAASMSKLPSHPPSKPSPQHLPKPQSQPWQKRSLIPVPTQHPKLLGKQVPPATIPPAPKTWDSGFPCSRDWRTQTAAAGKTTSLGSKAAGLRPNVGRSGNIAAPAKVPVPKGPSSSPPYKGDMFRPWRMPPPDLEVSQPITDEQRPIREMMKREAQMEREEAACWTSLGRIKIFEEREKEMDISLYYGYPSFGCPWRTSTWACPSGRLQAGNVRPHLGSEFRSSRD